MGLILLICKAPHHVTDLGSQLGSLEGGGKQTKGTVTYVFWSFILLLEKKKIKNSSLSQGVVLGTCQPVRSC